jgi:hypothetical protein
MRQFAIAPMLLLIAGTAAAAPSPIHVQIAGQRLAIDGTCASHVTITPDGTAGQMALDATARNQEELAQLRFQPAGDAARLDVTSHECWHPGIGWGFERTLAITLHVAPGTTMSIEDSGGVTYAAGDVGGPLQLNLSGGVTFGAGAMTRVKIDASGGVELSIASVKGPLDADLSGGATIKIGHIEAPEATFDASGGVRAEIGAGSIGHLKADASGGVELRVRATVGDAALSASGGGDISVAQVTGRLDKDESAGGDIRVGQ